VDIAAASSILPEARNQLDGDFRTPDKEKVGTRKMKHTFLIGMLCGVMITAAVTYVFAIPANNYHWKMEIWNRGGGAWTLDKNGHLGWKWMVEPKADAPQQKRVTAPVYKVNALTEQL
jgi:hypothetical protein